MYGMMQCTYFYGSSDLCTPRSVLGADCYAHCAIGIKACHLIMKPYNKVLLNIDV